MTVGPEPCSLWAASGTRRTFAGPNARHCSHVNRRPHERCRRLRGCDAPSCACAHSRLFRDLKLRGAIIKEKQLIMLPNEQLYNKVPGVWNLSSDQGNLGTFFISNVRLVWHANTAENFNVSIPYLQVSLLPALVDRGASRGARAPRLPPPHVHHTHRPSYSPAGWAAPAAPLAHAAQMKVVRVRDSKFGPALVVETCQRCGGYILGFRVDPAEQLSAVFQEIQSLHRVFSNTPVFGVDHTTEEKAAPIEQLTVARAQDDVEIVNTDDVNRDASAAYLLEGSKPSEREIELSPELGLAIEKLPDGYTAKSLWSVL